MKRKIYSFFIGLTVCIAVASSCKKDDGVQYTFSTQLNAVPGSSLDSFITRYPSVIRQPGTAMSQTNPLPYLSLEFSTDGGATFVQFPTLKVGQQYTVKVTLVDIYSPTGVLGVEDIVDEISGDNECLNIDWSASTPKPVSVNTATGTATFVLSGNNNVVATIADKPFPGMSGLLGKYTVVEDGWADFHAGDTLTVSSVDATHIQINEYPATDTNHAPLTIQVSPTGGTAIGYVAAATIVSQDNGYYSFYGAGTDIITSGSGGISGCGGINLSIDFVVTTYGNQGTFALVLQKLN